MFRNETQTSPLSLFSSTSSHPLALFQARCDADLPEDSAIILVHDATDAVIARPGGTNSDDKDDASDRCSANRWPGEPSNDWTMRGGSVSSIARDGASKGNGVDEVVERRLLYLDDPILHMQSPTLFSTFIQAGSDFSRAHSATELGITLGIVHFQLRLLDDHKPFMFEIGVRDTHGHPARLRWSTFQKEPRLSSSERHGTNTVKPAEQESFGALLHMPLSALFDEHMLTPWKTIAAPAAAMCKYLSAPPPALLRGECREPSIPPFDAFASIAYIRVHANCRLRRTWFSDHRQVASGAAPLLPGEFELFASADRNA